MGSDLGDALDRFVDKMTTGAGLRQDIDRVRTMLSLPGDSLRAATTVMHPLGSIVEAYRNEATPGADLTAVQEAWQAQLDQLVADWQADIAPAQRDELADQIELAVTAGDLAALAALIVTAAAGAGLLAVTMADLAATAAAQMAAEAAAQGVTITPAVVTAAMLQPVADAAAGILAAGLAAAAGREALRRANGQADGHDVAVGVVAVLEDLSDAGLRTQLGGALTRAQNLARLDTLTHAPAARLFANEHLDKNTCGPCRAIDGYEFESLAEAYATYGGGAYWACEGGDRCRGTIIAVWEV